MKVASAKYSFSGAFRAGFAALLLAVGAVGSVVWCAAITYGALAIIR